MTRRSGDDTLEMPCLGRPFWLGTLYDCRSDRLIMGTTLWDDQVIKAATSTNPQTASDFKVIAEDSVEDKTFNLDIDASLKLSFLGGLVSVQGSAKYLDDRKSSKRQAHVSIGVLPESTHSQWRRWAMSNISRSLTIRPPHT